MTRLYRPIAAALSAGLVFAACGDDPAPTEPNEPPPTDSIAEVTFAEVAAGLDHTCAAAVDGRLYCWGRGEANQLGRSVSSTLVPLLVQDSLRFGIVSSGHEHTCAVASGGAVYCWGQGARGELGNGSTDAAPSPSRISSSTPFVDIAAGGDHTCGLTLDGRVHCWGWNAFGQLGIGADFGTATPLPIVGEEVRFSRVAAGSRHTCALTPLGEVYCWGANDYGQLGTGDTMTSRVPALVAGALPFLDVTVGGRHACALAQDGRAFCWGDGRAGQLGTGALESSARPLPVAGGRTYRSITAGTEHTCAIASDGAAWCWGHDNYGRLGAGDTGAPLRHAEPVRVVGENTFRGLTAGHLHTCGTTEARKIFCWGFGGFGQLGNGGLANHAEAFPILAPMDTIPADTTQSRAE